MIIEPIPKTLGEYVRFSDKLDADDPSEALTLIRPDGTTLDVAHDQLTRVVNFDNSVTYSWTQALDQRGAWSGLFSSTGANANVVEVAAYVGL